MQGRLAPSRVVSSPQLAVGRNGLDGGRREKMGRRRQASTRPVPLRSSRPRASPAILPPVTPSRPYTRPSSSRSPLALATLHLLYLACTPRPPSPTWTPFDSCSPMSSLPVLPISSSFPSPSSYYAKLIHSGWRTTTTTTTSCGEAALRPQPTPGSTLTTRWP